MANARMRIAGRRRQSGWLQAVVFAVLAVVGGTALWTSLQYSEAHAAARASTESSQSKRDVAGAQWDEGLPGDQAADVGAGAGAAAAADKDSAAAAKEKGDPSASLAAWTELTTLEEEEGDGVGGGEQQQQGQQQEQEQQPAEGKVEELSAVAQKQDEKPAAAGGSGGSGGSSSSAAALSPGESYMTVELRVPKMPPTYNSWVLAEDMLLFHERALQQQLEQVYVALGVAAVAGRTFILPEFSCFCQNSDAPLPRCRRPDSSDLQFPVPCPEGEVLQPLDRFSSGGEGTPLKVLPHSALRSLELDESKVLVLKPSATILWPACIKGHPDPAVKLQCTYEASLPSGAFELAIPPSLNDTHLLPFLEPVQKQYPMWRLDLSDIGSHWHAFQGWDCAEPARQFDLRMRGAAKPWPLPQGSGMLALNMTSGRIYSDEPDMKQDCTAAASLRRMQAVGAAAVRLGVQL